MCWCCRESRGACEREGETGVLHNKRATLLRVGKKMSWRVTRHFNEESRGCVGRSRVLLVCLGPSHIFVGGIPHFLTEEKTQELLVLKKRHGNCWCYRESRELLVLQKRHKKLLVLQTRHENCWCCRESKEKEKPTCWCYRESRGACERGGKTGVLHNKRATLLRVRKKMSWRVMRRFNEESRGCVGRPRVLLVCLRLLIVFLWVGFLTFLQKKRHGNCLKCLDLFEVLILSRTRKLVTQKAMPSAFTRILQSHALWPVVFCCTSKVL